MPYVATGRNGWSNRSSPIGDGTPEEPQKTYCSHMKKTSTLRAIGLNRRVQALNRALKCTDSGPKAERRLHPRLHPREPTQKRTPLPPSSSHECVNCYAVRCNYDTRLAGAAAAAAADKRATAHLRKTANVTAERSARRPRGVPPPHTASRSLARRCLAAAAEPPLTSLRDSHRLAPPRDASRRLAPP